MQPFEDKSGAEGGFAARQGEFKRRSLWDVYPMSASKKITECCGMALAFFARPEIRVKSHGFGVRICSENCHNVLVDFRGY